MSSHDVRRCEDALRLLAAYLDGQLDRHSGARLEHHLATCRTCFSRAEFERRLKAALTALGREPVRPHLADRVRALIHRFDVAGGSATNA